MSDERFESSSLYDAFYHTPKTIGDIEKDIERLQGEITNIERLKYLAGLKKTAPLKMARDKEKLDKIREQIKKAATFDKDMSAARKRPNPNSPGTSNKETTTLPIISEVITVNKLPEFTSDSHLTYVRLVDNDYYSEIVETKIVGMEKVDWWEYVLIYGIFKALKISFEYTKLKDMIENGRKSSRTVSGKLVEINFTPKIRFEAKRNYETLDGQNIIRETGTRYESALLSVEVPQNKITKTNEYKIGYFLYEDTYDTLEVEYKKLVNDFDEIFAKYNIHESLKREIKKNLISYGRLSGI
jgi:hypothetical protein